MTVEHLEARAVLSRRVEEVGLVQGDPGGKPPPDGMPLESSTQQKHI